MTKKPAKFTDEEYEAWIERALILSREFTGRSRLTDMMSILQGIGIGHRGWNTQRLANAEKWIAEAAEAVKPKGKGK